MKERLHRSKWKTLFNYDIHIDWSARFFPHRVAGMSLIMSHLIALAAETKVAAKEFLNSLISPQNSRNFPAFTCFPCLICCKTGACRDVAVSFHIRLRHWDEDAVFFWKLVWDILISSTCAERIPCFDLEHLAAKHHVKPIDVLCCKAIPKKQTGTNNQLH